MSEDTILVTTTTTGMRGAMPKELKVDVLANNVNLFLTQIEGVLANTPETVQKFQFAEFTVSAEVSAKGQLVLLGTGGEAGATGGITFTFRKMPVPKKKEQPAPSS
jgi:hypothetical protein